MTIMGPMQVAGARRNLRGVLLTEPDADCLFEDAFVTHQVRAEPDRGIQSACLIGGLLTDELNRFTGTNNRVDIEGVWLGERSTVRGNEIITVLSVFPQVEMVMVPTELPFALVVVGQSIRVTGVVQEDFVGDPILRINSLGEVIIDHSPDMDVVRPFIGQNVMVTLRGMVALKEDDRTIHLTDVMVERVAPLAPEMPPMPTAAQMELQRLSMPGQPVQLTGQFQVLKRPGLPQVLGLLRVGNLPFAVLLMGPPMAERPALPRRAAVPLQIAGMTLQPVNGIPVVMVPGLPMLPPA
jgi:hypothetical protein